MKALFFFGDNGYRPTELGGSITCTGGADCVYQRYREDNAAELAAAGHHRRELVHELLLGPAAVVGRDGARPDRRRRPRRRDALRRVPAEVRFDERGEARPRLTAVDNPQGRCNTSRGYP